MSIGGIGFAVHTRFFLSVIILDLFVRLICGVIFERL